MAVVRPFQMEDVLEVELQFADLGEVQFTDEEFEGTLVVTNHSEKRLSGTLELSNETDRTLLGEQQSLSTIQLEVDLEPGETLSRDVDADPLIAGTGTPVIITVAVPELEETDEAIRIEPGETFASIASLVFWDREFYNLNYRRPRQAQYLSVVFAVLSTVLAATIVLISI